ncbi:MAG: hypothetical protein PHU46_17635, partial [Rhodocyclaceae bacterium]|nr:hypothetical protein [Rhodocyclaceae bacterium]
ATLVDANAFDFGAGTLTGNLALTAGGDVTDSGKLAVSGTTTILASGHDVTLNTSTNDFGGAVSLTAQNATLVDANAFDFGASTLGGNLALTAGGDVTDSGKLAVTGTTTIGASGHDVVLNTASNDFGGAVSLTAQNATLVDATAFDFGAGTLTGNLALTAGGDVTDSGKLAVSGTTTIGAGGHDVTLNTASNDFGGAVSLTAQNATLVDANAFDFGASTLTGNLSLTAAGDVTDSGKLAVSGTATIGASGHDVVLNTASNDFGGAVSLTAQNATLVDANAFDFGAGTLTGNLSLTAGGDVTDSGKLAVSGTTTIGASGHDVVLNTASNDFGGAVSLTATNATLVDATAFDFGASTLTGNLSLTAGGDVTDSGKLAVSGTTTIGASGHDVVLNTSSNDFGGAVSLTATNATLVDANAFDFGASTLTGNLALTAGGDVTDSSKLSVTGTTTITADGFDVVLDNATNIFGGMLTVDPATLTLVGANDLLLGNVVAHGNLVIRAGGGITQAIGTTILAEAGTTLTAGGASGIILENSGNDFVGAVSIAGGASASIADMNALSVGGDVGSLTATAGSTLQFAGGRYTNLTAQSRGDMSQSGSLSVSGQTSLTADTNGIWAKLDDTGNDFRQVLLGSLNHGYFKSADIRDANDLRIGGAADTLNVTTGGVLEFTGGSFGTLNATVRDDIIQTGALTVSGTATFTSDGDKLWAILDDAGNDFGKVVFAGANGTHFAQADIRDRNQVAVAGSVGDLSVAAVRGVELGGGGYGSLTVRAGADVSQSGALAVSGTTTLIADGGPIAARLDNAGNDFGNVILAAVNGSQIVTADLEDANDLTVGGDAGRLNVIAGDSLTFSTSHLGSLAASAGKSIAQTGALSVLGGTSLAAARDVVLQLSNAFGAPVVVTANGDVSLRTLGSLSLGSVSAGGGLVLAVGGNLNMYPGAVIEVARDVALAIAGDLWMAADAWIGVGGSLDGALGGAMTMADPGTAAATASRPQIIVGANLDLAAQGDIRLGRVQAGNAVHLRSEAGAILDNTLAEDDLIIAARVWLEAAQGVGAGGTDNINVAADEVDAGNSVAGGIVIADSRGFRVGSHGVWNGGFGSIQLSSAGSVAYSGVRTDGVAGAGWVVNRPGQASVVIQHANADLRQSESLDVLPILASLVTEVNPPLGLARTPPLFQPLAIEPVYSVDSVGGGSASSFGVAVSAEVSAYADGRRVTDLSSSMQDAEQDREARRIARHSNGELSRPIQSAPGRVVARPEAILQSLGLGNADPLQTVLQQKIDAVSRMVANRTGAGEGSSLNTTLQQKIDTLRGLVGGRSGEGSSLDTTLQQKIDGLRGIMRDGQMGVDAGAATGVSLRAENAGQEAAQVAIAPPVRDSLRRVVELADDTLDEELFA